MGTSGQTYIFRDCWRATVALFAPAFWSNRRFSSPSTRSCRSSKAEMRSELNVKFVVRRSNKIVLMRKGLVIQLFDFVKERTGEEELENLSSAFAKILQVCFFIRRSIGWTYYEEGFFTDMHCEQNMLTLF